MPDNPTEETVEINWVYTPADFFEEPILWASRGCTIEIEGGRVIARMSAVLFDATPGLQFLIRQDFGAYFLGAQLNRLKVFEIHGGAVSRLWPDGRRDTTVAVRCLDVVMLSDQVDLVQMDSTGRIVGDTRRDRIEATIKLAQLSVRHASDSTVRRMLEIFDAATRYPGNELVYLYEVWDALQTRFQRNRRIMEALGISRRDRSRLTTLANTEPLNQGRHRGQFDALRDATTDELAEARRIAKKMIEKFLLYLDNRILASPRTPE
jgi:hypothetical protein